MALGPDGHCLAVAFRAASEPPRPSCVRLFDLAQRGRFVECAGASGELTGVVCAGSGTTLVASAEDGKLRAWDARAGQLLCELDLGSETLALERSHDGTRALASGKEYVALVELAALRLLRKSAIQDLGSARPRFSADDRWFYVAAGTELLRFDARDGAAAGSCTLP